MSEVDINTVYDNYDTYSISDRHKLLKKINLSQSNIPPDSNSKLDKINKAHINDIHHKSFLNLSLLTIITLISFPLGFITGYFGMNFKYMKKGKNKILNIKYPNIKIIIVCISTALLVIYLFDTYFTKFDDDHDGI